MRELSESGKLKTFFDRSLIKALGHPVREHILAVFNERIASGSEIGEELGIDVSSFYHHIEELEKLGCIERVDSQQRRGAVEHFFQAKQTVFLDDAAWRELPASIRADIAASFVQLMFDDAATALEKGILSPNADEHVTWMPAYFDRRGWGEITDLLAETLERVIAIQKESATRLAHNKADAISASISILAFETAAREDAGATEQASVLGRTQRPSSAR